MRQSPGPTAAKNGCVVASRRPALEVEAERRRRHLVEDAADGLLHRRGQDGAIRVASRGGELLRQFCQFRIQNRENGVQITAARARLVFIQQGVIRFRLITESVRFAALSATTHEPWKEASEIGLLAPPPIPVGPATQCGRSPRSTAAATASFGRIAGAIRGR